MNSLSNLQPVSKDLMIKIYILRTMMYCGFCGDYLMKAGPLNQIRKILFSVLAKWSTSTSIRQNSLAQLQAKKNYPKRLP